jgi:serine phosphatase RsbU (regulator of sigma subunit)
VLWIYKSWEEERQVGLVAAEVATLAASISDPLNAALNDGNSRQVGRLLAVFGGTPYLICADLFTDGVTRQASWPVPGCARINTPGPSYDVPLLRLGADAKLSVRINQDYLNGAVLQKLAIVALLLAAGSGLLALSFVAAFLWFVRRPLTQLSDAIQRFEEHNDPVPAPYLRDDEAGRVSAGYNRLLELEVQRVAEIREAHDHILDSLSYAKGIQAGLLPEGDLLSRRFGDVAQLWAPVGVVSGDMVWSLGFDRPDGQPSRTLLALIDCTGHGVPGGFMTILATSGLEQLYAASPNDQPGDILARLNRLVKRRLKQHTEHAKTNDGLDITLCDFDHESRRLTCATAGQSLLVFDGRSYRRIRGDKVSIGYVDSPADHSFKNHLVDYSYESRFLLTTDGVIDQPGGERGLGFGLSRVVSHFSKFDSRTGVARQVMEFDELRKAWMANRAQVDDCSLILLRP